MNKKLGMAVAGAVMAFGATAANAGITIPAGDWTIDIGGNVNAFTTWNSCDSKGAAIVGSTVGGACIGEDTTSQTAGLLPAFLAISGKTRANDLDVGFTISLQPAVATNQALVQSANQENRQAFLTFGDASWGTVKLGKDLGIFGSDAILSDMTLLGIGGTAGALAGAANTTTTGRIGAGYMYADWMTQFSYFSPNWNGFSFAVGAFDPWYSTSNALGYKDASKFGVTADDNYSGAVSNSGHDTLGFQGKVQYEWAGDVAGKVWAGFFTQKVEDMTYTSTKVSDGKEKYTRDLGNERATAWEVGTKLSFADFEGVAYYYDGKGIGIGGHMVNGFDANGDDRDSQGWYVQGTYKLPIGTKIGLSYGKSELDANAIDDGLNLVEENRSWIIGAYHPLTKNLNLVAEYIDTTSKSNDAGAPDNDAKTFGLGAILFF